jgi:hypothetical protein
MTSFAIALEPPANPRLAALACALHLAAAAIPWAAHVPASLAAVSTLVALASLASTLAAVPGPHNRVLGVVRDGRGWRIRVREGTWLPAELGPRSRAFGGIAFLDIRSGGRRHAWLVTGNTVPADSFRHLKARIRLTC